MSALLSLGQSCWLPLEGFLSQLGALGIFLWKIQRSFWQSSGNLRPIMDQILLVTARSLTTVIFSGIFVGAILVLQFNQMLVTYDSQIMLGGLNTSALVREIGPLIISFLLAGKIGAYTTSELATMRVTEQIDAIECLGTQSLQYLILPRFIAIVFSSALLLVVGLVISIAGSIWIADVFCGINPLQYATTIGRFVGPGTLALSLVKCVIYGVIVAGVSCHQGYTASGGAQGVGKAVTRAAIYTNFYIILAQFLINNITENLRGL